MDVHDLIKEVSTDVTLEPGMVITIEPGLYIPVHKDVLPE
jgi:Xaa-Pro aminopeptidase